MTPKERRERLFRKGRPTVRRLEVMDGEQYSADMGILWAAYRAKSFPMPEGMTQEDFVRLIEQQLAAYSQVWIVDDRNASFSKGAGPVALVGTVIAALVVETKFLFFSWATVANKLKTVVAFLNMVRHSSKTGIVLVRTTKDKMKLPDHLRHYDMLYYLGRAAPDEFLYSIRGRA